MPVRRLALVLCTGLSLLVGLPQASQAKPIFNFSGAGDDGGVVWDGDADVGSMNNSQCGPANPNSVPEPTVTNCHTDVFSFPSQDLRNIQVTLSGLTRDQFDSVYIAFTVADCSVFSAFLCDSFDQLISTPRFQDMNNQLSDPSTIQVLALAVAGGTGSGPFGLNSTIITALNNGTLNQSLLNGLHIGILADAKVSQTAFGVQADFGAAAVPEPASMLLLGSGLAGLAAKRYRRRAKS